MQRLEYRIGRFVLRPDRQLLDGDAPVAIGRKALELLSVLARAEGALVTKDELMAGVWPSAVVEENAIQAHVVALRRVLGKDAELLNTVHGLGYRLMVTGGADAPTTSPPLPIVTAETALDGAETEITRKPQASDPERSPFTKPSVAVLPFANLTGDRDRAYFADGVTEEITRCLSRARTMFVVAGGSSPTLKGKGAKLREAARELDVRYLLEGSVRRAGGRLRIAAKLIDTADGVQLWADRYDEAPEDVFAFQDKVALAVTGAVEPAVVAAEMRWVLKHPSDNPSSYELYLRGLRHCRKRDREEYRIALDFLNRAIALDPEHRLALALAANMHSLIDLFGWAEDMEANRARGCELAYRAIMIAGDDAAVLAHAGIAIARLDGDAAAAGDLFARAVALNPASSYTWFLSGLFQAHFADADTAIEHLQTSLRLEPLAHRSNVVGAMAAALFRTGRFEESIAFAREAVQTADGPASHLLLAGGCAQLGRLVAAVAALDRYRELSSLPVEIFARKLMPHSAELKLFLDGIAAAEATRPG